VLLALSLIYFTYPVSAFLAHPGWKQALTSTLIPQLRPEPGYIAILVGLIGTTITPWMQFYLQASVVEKGISKKNLNLLRVDVILGCIVTDVIAFFIVVACAATIFRSSNREISDVAEVARRLRLSQVNLRHSCSAWA